MSAVVTRRTALRGSAAAALGLAASAAPMLAAAAPTAGKSPVVADAALIVFAQRTASLARRCEAVFTKSCDIRDRIEAQCPQRPIPPEPPSTTTSEWRDTADMRMLIIRQPLANPSLVEWRHLRAADEEAIERDRAAMGERLGLPQVDRRYHRMERRLHRWTNDLAGMDATTVQGLAAKAGAILSIVDPLETGPLAAGLILSTLRDAARLGGGAHA